MAANYVDDVILAATSVALLELFRISCCRFDVDSDVKPNRSQLGLTIRTFSDEHTYWRATKSNRAFTLLPFDCSFADFPSARGSLAWIQQTRLDFACALSMPARVTENRFNKIAIQAHSKVIRCLRRTKDIIRKYPKLDINTLCIVACVDTGHKIEEATASSDTSYYQLTRRTTAQF